MRVLCDFGPLALFWAINKRLAGAEARRQLQQSL